MSGMSGCLVRLEFVKGLFPVSLQNWIWGLDSSSKKNYLVAVCIILQATQDRGMVVGTASYHWKNINWSRKIESGTRTTN